MLKIISEKQIPWLKWYIRDIFIHKTWEISYLHLLEWNCYIVYKWEKWKVYKDINKFHFYITEYYYSFVVNDNWKQSLVINWEESDLFDRVFDCDNDMDETNHEYTENFWYLIKNNNERFIIFNGIKLKAYYGINPRHIKFTQDWKALKYRAKRIIDDWKRQWSYIENEVELWWFNTKAELNYNMEVSHVWNKLTCFRCFNNIYYPNKINLCIDRVNARLYKKIYEFYKSDILETYVLVLYKEEWVWISRSRVVHNGNLSLEYESIEWDDFIYIEEEDFLVYIWRRNGKYYLVIWDEECSNYDEVKGLTYDYWNKLNRFAFKARVWREWFIVINWERQSENYESFWKNMLIFWKFDWWFAYLIKKGDKYHAIVNGKIWKWYNEIHWVGVSRYSDTYNYWALDRDKRVYVIDWEEYENRVINLFDYLSDDLNIPESFKKIQIKTLSDPCFVIKNIIINEKNYIFDRIDNLEYNKYCNSISFIWKKWDESNIYLLKIWD